MNIFDKKNLVTARLFNFKSESIQPLIQKSYSIVMHTNQHKLTIFVSFTNHYPKIYKKVIFAILNSQLALAFNRYSNTKK